MATMAILALLVGNSFAQEKTANKPAKTQKQSEGKKKGVQKMMDEIPNLSQDQKTRILAVSDEARKQSEPQRKLKKELSEKIKELKAAENPNQNELNKMIDKLATVKAELAKEKTARI